jgi:signal transduction histidine kinase
MAGNFEHKSFARLRLMLRPLLIILLIPTGGVGTYLIWKKSYQRVFDSTERIVFDVNEVLSRSLGALSLLATLSSVETSLRYGSTESVEKILDQAVSWADQISAFVVLDSQDEIFALNSVASSVPYIGMPAILNGINVSKLNFDRENSDRFGVVFLAWVDKDAKRLLIIKKSIYYEGEPVGSVLGVIDVQNVFHRSISVVNPISSSDSFALRKKGDQSATTCTVSTAFLEGLIICGTVPTYRIVSDSLTGWILLLFACGFSGVSLLLIRNYVDRQFLAPVDAAFSVMEEIARAEFKVVDKTQLPASLHGFGDWINHLVGEARENQALKMTIAAKNARLELADQVAHDIKSPLTAMLMMEDEFRKLPEESRRLFKAATARITDIVNKHPSKSSEAPPEDITLKVLPVSARSREPLTELIDSVIEEKRIEFRNNKEIHFRFDRERCGEEVWVLVEPVEFKRVVSNLVNNAVEACLSGGVIEVLCLQSSERIEVQVRDSGVGIPLEIIKSLGRRGATFGKANGSGLGLFHAREVVSAFGGELKLESQENFGTTVTISLPLCARADWFSSELRVPVGATVVVLDDDPSIHEVWEIRFGKERPDVRVHHVYEGSEMAGIVAAAQTRNSLYLVDYDLNCPWRNGLDIVSQLQIELCSVIVTNRADELHVRDECQKRKVKLLSKRQATSVRIVGTDVVSGK